MASNTPAPVRPRRGKARRAASRSSAVIRDHVLGEKNLAVTIGICIAMVAVGLLIVLATSFGIYDAWTGSERVEVPAWVAIPLVLIFFLAGIGLCIGGPYALWQTYQDQQTVIGHYPIDEPWHYEDQWSATGIHADTGSGIRWALVGSLCLLYAGGGMLWHGVQTSSALWAVAGVLCAGGLGLTSLHATYRAFRRQRQFGPPFLRFGRYPFFIGQELNATAELKQALGNAIGCRVELRCEENGVIDEGGNTSSDFFTACLYEHSEALPIPAASPSTQTVFPVAIQLPADQPPTVIKGGRSTAGGRISLLSRKWTLTLHVDRADDSFTAQFLIPVYRPAGEECEADLIVSEQGR